MLAKVRDTLFSEQPHQEEEYRLLHELNTIDQHLRSRRQSLPDHEEIQIETKEEGRQAAHQNKWYFAKENQYQDLYNPNMEYFSEICNEEFEDDSLFDPQNNFLAPQKPPTQSAQALYCQQACSRPQKKKLIQSEDNKFPLKNSRSQASFPSQSQILKQHNYIYKKEKNNPSLGAICFPPPPRTSKSFNRKSSVGAQKVQTKAPMYVQSKQRSSKGSFIKKNKSKEKQISKPAIKQEVDSFQSEERQQDQFKFQTFQVLVEGARGEVNESSEKNKRKSKCKHEDQNPDSLECTFKPTILKKSSEMVKSTKNVVERLSASGISIKEDKKPYQKQISKPVLNRNRIQQLSQPRRLKTQGPEVTEETPSFRPSLSKKSLEQMSHCTYDVATRNQLWLEQKAEKLERLRQEEEKERKRKEDCTYAPSLCPYKGENNPQLSRFGRQGMANYFERLTTQKSTKSKALEGKQNRCSITNMNSSKDNFVSKGGKKQKYEEAVKQLHNRIMGLKI